MNAFICVYRHKINPSHKRNVYKISKNDPLVKEFLDSYILETNVYDWGDDPAFFMATKEFDNPNFATWGVCRPNVRKLLTQGDLVIFFCAKQKSKQQWDYYFVGYGTVKNLLNNREELWTNYEYRRYKGFYNFLVKDGKQFEPFGKLHEDWQKRAEAPYVFFEEESSLTKFNIISPLIVASYRSDSGVIDQWHSDINILVKELRHILLDKYFKTNRTLRTTNPRVPHNHIRVSLSQNEVSELRKELSQFC